VCDEDGGEVSVDGGVKEFETDCELVQDCETETRCVHEFVAEPVMDTVNVVLSSVRDVGVTDGENVCVSVCDGRQLGGNVKVDVDVTEVVLEGMKDTEDELVRDTLDDIDNVRAEVNDGGVYVAVHVLE
jgi:hypothetical protein